MRLVAREKVDRMNGGAVRWTLGMRFSVFDFGYGHGICLLHSTNATFCTLGGLGCEITSTNYRAVLYPAMPRRV